MIELEARLSDAVAQLPGPDAGATERARAHVLATFAPPGEAPAGADPGPPADRVEADGLVPDAPTPAPRPAHRRRRILALGGGLATVAALAAAVIVAGLPHGAAPPTPPAGTGTTTVPTAPPRLDGTLAFLRDGVLYTVTDGGEPVRLARLPELDDARMETRNHKRALAVSPDGTRVAVVSPGGPKRTLSIYDRATGDATIIPMPPNFTTSQAFFSVDGDVLFVSDRFDLLAVTDRARRIAHAGGDIITIAPDGSGIALNHASKAGLVFYDTALLRTCADAACEAAKHTIIANLTGAAGDVVWGPGADQPIAYVDRDGTQVISAATPGAAPLPIASDKYPLTFTRDGRELIVQTVGATPLLEAISIERRNDGSGTRYSAGPSRPVATLSAAGASYFGMTRDGTAFLVGTGNGARYGDLRLVPVDGGPALPLGIAADAVAWSGMTLPGEL